MTMQSLVNFLEPGRKISHSSEEEEKETDKKKAEPHSLWKPWNPKQICYLQPSF